MKNALITGVSRGLGKAIAKQLSSEGYVIYGTYNASSSEALEQLKKEISQIVLYKVDLSKREHTQYFITQLKGVTFDALINNAGTYILEDFQKMNTSTWDYILELNVTAPMLLATSLKNNITEGGVIVNISSIWGAVYGGTSAISYATSKAAIASLTKTLANMYGNKKVQSVGIAPGMVETDLSQSNGQAVLDAIAKRTPLGRIGQPHEIANIVSFLISKKASYINGAVIVADGGYSCGD